MGIVNITVDKNIIDETVARISSMYGLVQQGEELVSLITKTVQGSGAAILFLDTSGDVFSLLAGDRSDGSSFGDIRLNACEPCLEILLEEKKVLRREQPEADIIFRAMNGDADEYREKTDLLIPLVSNNTLLGIILVDKYGSEPFDQEEILLLSDISSRVTVYFEKEYLIKRLIEREKELSVLAACSSILSSSLNIAHIYHKFVMQLQQLVDVDWAAILLADDDELSVFSIYSNSETTLEPGEQIPVKGSSTEMVMTSLRPLLEHDLDTSGRNTLDLCHKGIRSVACVPLIVNSNEAIGSLIIGSEKPNMYNPQKAGFLEKLASHIAMPVRNACLYADVLQKSRYDELTGLLNRRTMDEQISNEVSRHSRYGGIFSLIFMDLDSLKHVNDQYGHLAGDGLLSRIGAIISETIRSADQAFRYGGDEFAILLPNTPADAAVKVAERLRKKIMAKIVIDDRITTASFGVSSWPESGIDPEDMVAAADEAVYQAKNNGKNQTCYNGKIYIE